MLLTFWICWANSRVGPRIRAWVAWSSTSMFWRHEMAKVAVLPVPDWAWAMTSWPLVQGTMARIWIARANVRPWENWATLWKVKSGLTWRLLETVTVDTTEELLVEAHVVEGLGDLVPVGLDQSVDSHTLGAAVARAHFHFTLVAWGTIIARGVITSLLWKVGKFTKSSREILSR